MKIILSLVLGIYSVAMGTYALSEFMSVYGDCTAGCFKGESPFPGGDGSSGGNRKINVQYRASGNNSFAGADTGKLSGALTTATDNWNGKTSQPYRFSPSQSTASGNVNLEIVYVDEIKSKSGKSICAKLETTKNQQTGAIDHGILYIPKKVLEKSSQEDLAEIIQHELGHFIGLAYFYGKADMCQTTMAQAKEGCTSGLQGSQAISDNDVANVNKYVANNGQCKRDRVSTPVIGGGGGGYTDPNPAPIFYPRTCYYFYDAIDLYWCWDGCRYIGTVYYLTDVWCTY